MLGATTKRGLAARLLGLVVVLGTAAWLGLYALAAAGSRAPSIAVFNNSGAELTIVTSMFGGYVIAPSGHEVAAMADMLPPGLLLGAAGCFYGYDLPPVAPEYSRPDGDRAADLTVQVEPDFSLLLLPLEAPAIDPEAGKLPMQARYGYPLRPGFRACPPEGASE